MPPTRQVIRRCATLAIRIALASLLAAPRFVDAQSVSSGDSTLRTRLDSLFAPWSGTDRPGCAVGVSEHERVLIERAYGMADIESAMAMSSSTIVHSASLAKSVTALSVLLLVRDGKLALDDDVRRHLPELPDYSARYGTPITVRHLLTHTSGLRDFFEMLILARGRFEEERITEADAMAIVRRQRALNFAPGTQYGYTNTGYLLAAQIVARVSGQPFATFAAQRIFAPLGMSHTRIRDDVSTLVPGRAVGYARRGAGWRTSVPNFDVVGSTYLLTTTGDLLRWAGNLAHPVVGDSALVQQLLTPSILANGDTTAYGLGLSLVRDRGFKVAEHEGRDPGFRAYLGWYREPGVAVALLCNAAALDPVGLGRRVAALTLGLPVDAPASTALSTATNADDAARALRWAGVYLEPSTRQVAELTVRDGVLYTDRAGGARVEAIDARRARLVGQPLELEFGPGPRAGYRVRWLIPGRRADSFEWRAPATVVLDRAALAAFAGTYVSRELDATFRVDAGDSTLTLRAGVTPGLVARPVFADTFVSGQYTIQFVRTRGHVTGFEISHPRARGLSFTRASTSG
jgi:CubicO group peptidase (beta-lactamase class C family)